MHECTGLILKSRDNVDSNPDIENTVVGRYCLRMRVHHSLVMGSLLLLLVSFFLLSFYTAILSRQLKPDRFPRLSTSDPDFGTEDPPLSSLENERNISYLIFKKNDSAALSLLNKVCYFSFGTTCEMCLFFSTSFNAGQSRHATFQKL